MGSIVSSITGSVGGNRGGAGLNYNADQANILAPNTVDQANEQYNNVNNGLANQQAFLQAVQGQNGLGNQSQVFSQLQGVANGTGPNPAQAMLNQATQANVANQSALMAGQRGAGSNVGLIARQAAQQGAQTEQNAAGQAATMQANQSLNALGQMSGVANQQAAQQASATNAYSQAAQGAQQNVLGGIAAQNNANVGMTSNQNNANAGISGIAAQGQQHLIGNLLSGAGAAFMAAKGGQVPSQVPSSQDIPMPAYADGGDVAGPKSRAGKFFQQMSSGFGDQSQQAGSSQTPSGLAGAGQAIGKGFGTGLKSLFGGPSKPNGAAPVDSTGYTGLSNEAQMQQDADMQMGQPIDPTYGGIVQNGPATQDQSAISNALGTSDISGGSDASGLDSLSQGMPVEMAADGGSITDTIAKIAPMIAMLAAAQGGKVPALVSPGERYLSPEKVAKVAEGKADPIKDGKKVPGTPKVAGAKNSYANDTVPAKLEPGGIVIPRSVTQGKNPGHAAKKFVEAILAKNAKSLPAKGR